ncbi:hypothetical protein OF83DRAFT_1225801 [Amylostereum chailletii]|nr:hypothetical protein OF83DRAFT_1225801 [Amylostereum chailletii]
MFAVLVTSSNSGIQGESMLDQDGDPPHCARHVRHPPHTVQRVRLWTEQAKHARFLERVSVYQQRDKSPQDQVTLQGRTTRCFHHIRMAKRGGRAHSTTGIEGTQAGELALACPACPNPTTNLERGWEKAPKNDWWRYAMMVVINANFKLKLKNRPNLHEINLSDRFTYFVVTQPYLEHLQKNNDEAEMKHCRSLHSAVNTANMPGHKRFAIDGVGAVICAQHLFYLAQGVGDLQHGERYVDMDYIVLSGIWHTAHDMRTLYFLYDIACQWSKNFLKRLKTYPQFKDLKGIKVGWADCNGAALSTREMSNTFRHEALDDIFGGINWRKLINMGTLFLTNLKKAVAERDRHCVWYNEHIKSFPPLVVESWIKMIEAWEEDDTKPNPYQEPARTTLMNDVHYETAVAEAKERDDGTIALHKMTASIFLNTGFDLENQMDALKQKASEPYLPPSDKTSLQLCSEELRTKELRLRIAQALDALHHVRRQLRVRLAVLINKGVHTNGLGQRSVTRSQSLVNRINDRLHGYVRTYRQAYTAIQQLDPTGKNVKEQGFEPLMDGQVRSPKEDMLALGEGQKEVTWLWRVHQQDERDIPGETAATEEEVHKSRRVDFVRARPRVMR